MAEDPKKTDAKPGEVETTGHEWDGIKEYNNPLPRWWLWVFYATVAWSVVYWVLMPAWPGLPGTFNYTTGVRNHSERANVAEALGVLSADRREKGARLIEASLESIESDPALLEFALAAGESAFGDNCATCHGTGAQGFIGYPNLNDDDWLWGGSLSDIEYTLVHGIRAGTDETRFSLMPAYGRDGLFDRQEIIDLVEYVMDLSGREADAEAVARAEDNFQAQCATCHMSDGTGDPSQGAPNLTDAIWLYGGDRSAIHASIFNARAGVMPAWQGRLDEQTIKALAVYVHALGGGE